MGSRTILEINHCMANAVRRGGREMADLLAQALATGLQEDWDKLRPYGIKRIVECHHTEPRRVIVSGREYVLG